MRVGAWIMILAEHHVDILFASTSYVKKALWLFLFSFSVFHLLYNNYVSLNMAVSSHSFIACDLKAMFMF
jgi:hypothetical protein